MSPMSSLVEQAYLGYEFGKTAPTAPPTTQYIALFTASVYAGTFTPTLNSYYVGSAFTTNRHIFKATAVSGATSGTEPSWSGAGAGQTFTDGGVTWTECTNLIGANTITGLECSGGGYARASVTNNTVTWPAPSTSIPSQVQNGAIATFPLTTASWGILVGFGVFDAATAGNLRWWGLLSATSAVATVAGTTPDFAVAGLTFTLL